jgi:hypothetical protein
MSCEVRKERRIVEYEYIAVLVGSRSRLIEMAAARAQCSTCGGKTTVTLVACADCGAWVPYEDAKAGSWM